VTKLFEVVFMRVSNLYQAIFGALCALAISASGCGAGIETAEPEQTSADPLSSAPDTADGSTQGATCQAPAPADDAAPPEDARVDTAARETCPEGMVLVDGNWCPTVRRDCARWLEDPDRFSYARCAEYEPIPICLAPRQHKRFCIDRDEYTVPGAELPSAHQSWVDARHICEGQGKRLCQESEWEFACEGEAMLPYPYGLVRDASICNFDQQDLYLPDGSLRDMREPSNARPNCESPFGVRNMVGNLDEWTVRETTPGPHRSVLRGGWWLAARDRCRAATTAHGETYEGPQTGVRCCSAPEAVAP
jgi:formylglycine-generating enzyme